MFYPGDKEAREGLAESISNDVDARCWAEEVEALCAYILEIEQRCRSMGTALTAVQRETRELGGRCTLSAEVDCMVEAALFGRQE